MDISMMFHKKPQYLKTSEKVTLPLTHVGVYRKVFKNRVLHKFYFGGKDSFPKKNPGETDVEELRTGVHELPSHIIDELKKIKSLEQYAKYPNAIYTHGTRVKQQPLPDKVKLYFFQLIQNKTRL